jgi:hypothetical protein
MDPAPVQEPRWYFVDKTGVAILCTDEDNAKQGAKQAEKAWPRFAPYRAVQLCEYTTAPAPAPVQESDCVLVPRDLVGAACAAIEGKRDAPKTLEQLRRYTTGDLSTPPAAPAPVQQKPLFADIIAQHPGLAEELKALSEGFDLGFKAGLAAAQPAVPTVPMQPIVVVGGVTRFKANAIVSHLLQTHPTCDMNKLASMDFTDEDRMQFAQLIGYSVGGYAELSYVSDESYEAAEKAAHGITASPEKGQP